MYDRGYNRNVSKTTAPVPAEDRKRLIAQALTKFPWLSVRQLAISLSHHGLTPRTWEREINKWLDERGLYRGSIKQDRARQIVVCQTLIQQHLKGHKGSAAAIIRLLVELTGTLEVDLEDAVGRGSVLNPAAIEELRQLSGAWDAGADS